MAGDRSVAIGFGRTELDPVRREARVQSLDIMRGIALLGILVVNIMSFAAPHYFGSVPFGFQHTFEGSHATLNKLLFSFNWIFVQSKMRGMLSMLFGASVILLSNKAERQGREAVGADLFLRRNMWLVAIGLVHYLFLFDGDILHIYGIVALLFLYPCRRLRAKTLISVGAVITLVICSYDFLSYTRSLNHVRVGSSVAIAAARSSLGFPRRAADELAVQAWDRGNTPMTISSQMIEKDIRDRNSGYSHVLGEQATSLFNHAPVAFAQLACFDVLGMMLLGMGLSKIGYLSGELPGKTYALIATVGFLISIPPNLIGLSRVFETHFGTTDVFLWLLLPYSVFRLAMTLTISSTIILLVKAALLGRVGVWLANVGRTALSNYVLTSALCEGIFLWSPWKLYGRLPYFEVYGVVAGIWLINLAASTFWLRFFEFGPIEWIWRSLTYARFLPLRRRDVLS